MTPIRYLFAMLFFGTIASMLSFGCMAVWDANYGVSLCEARHDWFDRECIRYTFDYANVNLGRVYLSAFTMIALLLPTMYLWRDQLEDWHNRS